MRKDNSCSWIRKAVPVLIFSLLSHSVLIPTVEASFFDAFFPHSHSSQTFEEWTELKPYALTIDSTLSGGMYLLSILHVSML